MGEPDRASAATESVSAAVLRPNYASVGQILDFQPAPVDSRVSNQHFRVRAESGSYILKQLANPDTLFESAGRERLQVVSRAVRALARSGLRVEHIVATDRGDLCVTHGSSVFRLYQLIPGRAFDGSDSDRISAARALRAFHDCALEALEPELVAELSRFSTAYPLPETRPHFDEIMSFVRAHGDRDVCAIAAHESLIREEIALVGRVDTESPPQRLLHLDFHPHNAIFETGRETAIIDLDNMLLGPPFKCLAFSIARFAQPDGLAESLELWQEHYGFDDPRRVLDFMAYLEVEKVLRILYRVMRTGTYQHFLPNIAVRHVPSLLAVRSLRARL